MRVRAMAPTRACVRRGHLGQPRSPAHLIVGGSRRRTQIRRPARRTDQDSAVGEEVLRQIARVKSEAERRVASGSGDHASSDGVASEPTPESIELAQGVRRAAELLSTGLVEREVEVKLMLLAAPLALPHASATLVLATAGL